MAIENNAPWVGITPAPTTDIAWRCVKVHHLDGAENGGRHNVYCDLVDENYNRLNPADSDAKIGFTWEGRKDNEPAPPYAMDKRPPEPQGNVPLFSRQVTEVWITGSLPSDHVSNLRTWGVHELEADTSAGNSGGHHSYYLAFMRVKAAIVPPVIIQPPTGILTVEQRLAMLEADMIEVKNAIGAKG